jgi:hypothetical protein
MSTLDNGNLQTNTALPDTNSRVEFITPEHLETARSAYNEVFPEYSIRTILINSLEDLNNPEILAVLSSAIADLDNNIVTHILVNPIEGLYIATYNLLGDKSKVHEYISTIENIEEHELRHYEAALKIKNGEGVVNQFGVRTDFSLALMMLVHSVPLNRYETEFAPNIAHGMSMIYSEGMPLDHVLAIDLETILAEEESIIGLSGRDRARIRRILNSITDETPILRQYIIGLPMEVKAIGYDMG